MSIKLLALYFVIGGAVVAAASYFGNLGKSQWAAFIAFLPSISVITLCSIYLATGTKPAVSYAKDMLLLLPSWVLYALTIIFLLPRIGLVWTLIIGIALYVGSAFLISRLV